jgi:xanthine dehydrogenase accessory factor
MRSDTPSQSSAEGLSAEIVRLQRTGRAAALATPLWSRGSVPMSHHARLLYRDDGTTRGTVGGGPLEAQVIRVAPEVMRERRARVLEFDLTEADAAQMGMICGGHCAIVVEPITPDYAPDVFAAADRAERTGRPLALITVLGPDRPPRKLALPADGEMIGTTGDAAADDALRAAARSALEDGAPRTVEQPVPAHIAPLLPRPPLFIFGAGHIGLILAHMAGLVGFRVTVVDDREEFANRRRFPRADQVLVASVPDAFSRLPVAEDGYIVAVTRGHAMDEEVVARALRTPARYIGMIGSRRKVTAIRERLLGRGFSQDDLARLHAPIGLDIGADTVEEIGVSILAQLIAVRRQG